MCEPTEILIFPCSGGPNVGQITNEAAKTAKKIVAIDGCPVLCVKKIEHAGFDVAISEIITEMGIEKKHNFIYEIEKIESVTNKIFTQI